MLYESSTKTWKPDVTSPCVAFQGVPAESGKHTTGDAVIDTNSIEPADIALNNNMEGLEPIPSSVNTSNPSPIGTSVSENFSISKKSTILVLYADVILNNTDIFSFLVRRQYTVAVPSIGSFDTP